MTAATQMTIYTVRADAESGEWLSEPEATDETSTFTDWHEREDTDAVLHDHYVPDPDAPGQPERLIRVEWVSADADT